MKIIISFLISMNLFALDGSYTIPSELTKNKEFSQFTVQNIEKKNNSIIFSLPPNLVSEYYEPIMFTETIENIFESDAGRLSCTKNDNDLLCHVSYTKSYGQFLKSKKPELVQFLKENGASEFEIKQRVEVLERFSNDPIGVLVIYKY